MENLISGLRKNHVWIRHLLFEAQVLGIHTDEGYRKVIAAQNDLIKHFGDEKKELFPVLKQKSHSNKELSLSLKLFEKDFAMGTDLMTAFFSNVKSKKLNDIEMAAELDMFYNFLIDRIWREEEFLYAQLEEMIKKESLVSVN